MRLSSLRDLRVFVIMAPALKRWAISLPLAGLSLGH